MGETAKAISGYWRDAQAALKSLASAWQRRQKGRPAPYRRSELEPPFRRKVLFEMLEQRILLSGSPFAAVSAGVLSTNLDGANDDVVVQQLGETPGSTGYDIRITVGALAPETYNSVSSIVVDGLGGND